MQDDFGRYQCQIRLPGFGEDGQRRLQEARVLIVGAGGLGCPAAQYLAAAGIGTLGIADDDLVDEHNLHRQILFTPEDVGMLKVMVASERLQQQNPLIKVLPLNVRVSSFNVMELIEGFDLIIEGTDNFETKYLLNDACVLSGKPLIYGAIYQYEGQVSVWNVLQSDGSYSANYRDAFPNAETARVPDCADGGVIPTLAGVVGSMQANEAIKYFTGAGDLLAGKLWMFNIQEGKTHIVNLKPDAAAKITGLTTTIPTLTLDYLQKKLKDYQLIDVRREEEHKAFNIGGNNMPLGQLDAALDAFQIDRPIVCYCASGKRSLTAARLIKSRFPEAVVYSLKGGIGAK